MGATPLEPGATVPPGTRVGITWSGCYGDRSAVPAVVGLTFAAARHALHARRAHLGLLLGGRGHHDDDDHDLDDVTTSGSSTTTTLPP